MKLTLTRETMSFNVQSATGRGYYAMVKGSRHGGDEKKQYGGRDRGRGASVCTVHEMR